LFGHSKKQNREKKWLKLRKYIAFSIITIGFLIPDKSPIIPIENASEDSWNHATFWHEPWGNSGTHKGIDIFAPASTSVISPTKGLVIWSGKLRDGGNVVYLLGPKWKVHYFAHLKAKPKARLGFTEKGGLIGLVGNSGNAKNRPSHLHYSIFSLFPHFWLIDNSTQGWKKMFYLNPTDYLLD
jgi:murein DD-endopeptidase MepM/ murein hydrolase activator NlpD